MQQTINVGTVAGDGTGDQLRSAFTKANSNFSELYASASANAAAITAEATARTAAGYLTSAALIGYATTSSVTTSISAAVTGLATAASVTAEVTARQAALASALPSAPVTTLYAGTGAAGGASLVTLGTNLSITGGVLNAAGSSSTAYVETAYSASGAISPADDVAVLLGSTALSMTLTNGTTAGKRLRIKRLGTGTYTVSATIDGASKVLTLSSPQGGECVDLDWSTAQTSWLLLNFFDPGTSAANLATATLATNEFVAVFDPTTGNPSKTTLGALQAFVVSRTLSIDTIAGHTTSTAFGVTGVYLNYTPAALDYSLDGGTTWTAATSPTFSGNAFGFTLPGQAAGTYTLYVRDHTTTSIQAISNSFVVSAAAATGATTPATAPSSAVVGTAITGLTSTITPSGATAYASLTIGGVEQTPRVSFTSTSLPSLTPATAGTATISVWAAATGGSALATTASFPVTITATGASLSGFPTTGTQGTGLVLTGASVTLTPSGATAYAVLALAGTDEGSRVAFTGTTPPARTPASSGSYTYKVYAAATGGTALATSPTITVAAGAATAAHYLKVDASGAGSANMNKADESGVTALDVRCQVNLSSYSAGSGGAFPGRLADTWNGGGFILQLDSSGHLQLIYRTSSANQFLTSTAVVPAAINTDVWLRGALDTGTLIGRLYYSLDNSTWTQIGSDVTMSSGAFLTSGSTDQLTMWANGLANGRHLHTQVRINGTLVKDVDFTAQTTGTTSFTATVGGTVTVNSPATVA